MANLNTLGAVAGGIMNGMSMRQAMNTKAAEQERLTQEHDWRRQDQEAKQADRARAEKERTSRDVLYGEIAGIHDPRSPADTSRTEPGTTAPVETSSGPVEAASPAALAKSGISSAFPKPQTKAFNYDAIDQDMATLNGFKTQAYKLRDQGALAMVEDKKKELYSAYLAQFQGDPMKDPAGFAEHAGRVSARFGNPLSPEQAFQYAKASKAYEQEGALDALKLAHTGNKDAALKAYNGTGQHQFQDIELTPAKAAYGIPSYNIVGVNADGSRHEVGNAMDAMIGLLTGKEQADLAMKRMDVESNIATREANRADKVADNARANDTLAETKRHHRAIEGKGGPDGLTTPQQRTNAAIEAARQQLVGMTESEIKRRTQAYTETGRENPEFDPQLASLVRQARSRKYGEDAAADAFAARKPQPAAKADTPRARFEAEPSMKGHTLGKPTGKGWEVIGPDGKLAGYWN